MQTGQPAHLFSRRSEAGALNTGQRSIRGPGCPAAIFSLAVSNETALKKKGLLQGHPALPKITPETCPQKKHSVHRATLALDTQFKTYRLFLQQVEISTVMPSQSGRLGERNDCWRSLITQSLCNPHTTRAPNPSFLYTLFGNSCQDRNI